MQWTSAGTRSPRRRLRRQTAIPSSTATAPRRPSATSSIARPGDPRRQQRSAHAVRRQSRRARVRRGVRHRCARRGTPAQLDRLRSAHGQRLAQCRVPLPGEGFIVTSTFDPRDPQAQAKMGSGQYAGAVYQWQPDRGFAQWRATVSPVTTAWRFRATASGCTSTGLRPRRDSRAARQRR